jgi:hypothetical protein
MKTLSTLFLMVFVFAANAEPTIDPNDKEKSAKHVEHNLNFAHDIPMASFYDLTSSTGGDSTILAFSIILHKDSVIRVKRIPEASKPKRVVLGVYIYTKGTECPNAATAKTLQKWLDVYSNNKSQVFNYNLAAIDYKIKSFTTPFREGNIDDSDSPNRRGIQFKLKPCNRASFTEEERIRFHDGTTVTHPKG